ncbi:putative short chain dehydrogenase/ reductase [Usnea florida]
MLCLCFEHWIYHLITSLEGKVVVITGTRSGIGRATATLLAKHSVLLSVADSNAKALKSVQDEQKRLFPTSSIFTVVVDVRLQEACSSWISDTVAKLDQPIARAANPAGVFGPGIAQERSAIRHITDAEFDFVMAVNVKGLLNCLRAELPHMLEGSTGRGGGAIVNAASIAGLVGVEYNGPYVASKHAVIGMTRTVAKEEGPRAIRVNAIAPGIIATPMIKQIEEAKGSTELFGAVDPGALARKGDAEEVAKSIVFLLSPESSFVNGVVIPVDGGWIC